MLGEKRTDAVLPAIAEQCRLLGANFDDWHGDEDKFLEDTINSIPSVKVTLELVVVRDRQCGGAIMTNDFRDVSFPAAAIPYGDVVVTDRYWADMARRTGLGRRFGTEILSDVRRLSQIL